MTFELRSRFDADLWQEVDGLVKAQGWPLKAFGTHRISLEDTFLELTRASHNGGKTGRKAEKGGE